jgi:phosphatidylserine synthase 2
LDYQNQVDIFVLAHVLGWYGKSLILRDYWFCWILSIMFEVMEYSLQHQLANFAECWWDHVRNLLDCVVGSLSSVFLTTMSYFTMFLIVDPGCFGLQLARYLSWYEDLPVF